MEGKHFNAKDLKREYDKSKLETLKWVYEKQACVSPNWLRKDIKEEIESLKKKLEGKKK
jgi:hypothetical protein